MTHSHIKLPLRISFSPEGRGTRRKVGARWGFGNTKALLDPTEIKTLRDMLPYAIEIFYQEALFAYIDGIKQEMEEDMFDQMVENANEKTN